MKLLKSKVAEQASRQVQAVLEDTQRSRIQSWKEHSPKVGHDVVKESVGKELDVVSHISREASSHGYTTLELQRLQVALWLAFKNVTDEMTRIFQNIPMKQAAKAIERGR